MIRKFEKGDINDVMQIWKNENIKTHQFISKKYWENNYNYVKEILPNAEIYVYVIEENIVGFIGLDQNYIEGIFIDTNNQCNGIGTSLLNKVKEDKDNLTLSVYKKNLNAISFYKKNGFVIIKESIDERTNEVEYIMSWEKQKNKVKKIIAMDLDGTLLKDNKECPKSTKEYLKKLKDEGYIIVIATGRILKSAKDITDGAEFANYIVADSGSVIYDNKYKNIISESIIDKPNLIKICEGYKSDWGILELCDEQWCNVYTDLKYKPREYDNLILNINDFLNNNQKITHISIIPKQYCVYKIIDKLKEELPTLTVSLMQDSFSDLKYIEIHNNEINKYKGIKLIANKEEIENKNIICFGDGLNDIDMIEKSGIGVAMENALSEIKQIAEFTTLSNNNEGIKYFLEQNLNQL